MRSIPTAGISALITHFGRNYGTPPRPRVAEFTEGKGASFVVPGRSLDQAMIAESMVDMIVKNAMNVVCVEAALWLMDWPIYYKFELQLFLDAVGLDFVDNAALHTTAVYWDRIGSRDIRMLKAGYFMLMAFEFTGIILFKSPDVAIYVNDGMVALSAADNTARAGLVEWLKQQKMDELRIDAFVRDQNPTRQP